MAILNEGQVNDLICFDLIVVICPFVFLAAAVMVHKDGTGFLFWEGGYVDKMNWMRLG